MTHISHELADELLSRQALSVKNILLQMLFEVEIAKEQHPKWPADVIHQAAIVAEEAGELLKAAVSAFYEHHSPREMASEAIQTGATVIRFLSHIPAECYPEKKIVSGGLLES